MSSGPLTSHVGHRIILPGHFDIHVILEDTRALGSEVLVGYKCGVRLSDGSIDLDSGFLMLPAAIPGSPDIQASTPVSDGSDITPPPSRPETPSGESMNSSSNR